MTNELISFVRRLSRSHALRDFSSALLRDAHEQLLGVEGQKQNSA